MPSAKSFENMNEEMYSRTKSHACIQIDRQKDRQTVSQTDSGLRQSLFFSLEGCPGLGKVLKALLAVVCKGSDAKQLNHFCLGFDEPGEVVHCQRATVS